MAATVVVDTYVIEGDRYVIPHDPDDITDYPFDWSKWLAKTGDGTDTIQSAVSILDAGLLQHQIGWDNTHVTIWAKNGTRGKTQRLTCQITTAQGRKQSRSIFLRVIDR